MHQFIGPPTRQQVRDGWLVNEFVEIFADLRRLHEAETPPTPEDWVELPVPENASKEWFARRSKDRSIPPEAATILDELPDFVVWWFERQPPWFLAASTRVAIQLEFYDLLDLHDHDSLNDLGFAVYRLRLKRQVWIDRRQHAIDTDPRIREYHDAAIVTKHPDHANMALLTGFSLDEHEIMDAFSRERSDAVIELDLPSIRPAAARLARKGLVRPAPAGRSGPRIILTPRGSAICWLIRQRALLVERITREFEQREPRP